MDNSVKKLEGRVLMLESVVSVLLDGLEHVARDHPNCIDTEIKNVIKSNSRRCQRYVEQIMTKGTKVNTPSPPEKVMCDFCGRKFKPKVWNSRTCMKCSAEDAPNQGEVINYERVLDTWLKQKGRRQKRNSQTKKEKRYSTAQ